MEMNQHSKLYAQPRLFSIDETSLGTLEIIPKLWFAAEALSSPDSELRKSGLSEIVDSKSARLSSLISYILYTRITDPDLDIRKIVVSTLANVLRPDDDGLPAVEDVRINLYTLLSQMDFSQARYLLHLAAYDPATMTDVEILLRACTYAGDYLTDIITDRSESLEVREMSANYIGRIGYLDAQPALRRFANKLEAKLNGQQAMPFNLSYDNSEITLLPSVRKALEYLQSP